MKNIVVVGLGNLGKRHLQSILDSQLELTVYGIDISEEVLEGFPINSSEGKQFYFISDYADLPPMIDLAIIATSSSVRRECFDKLVNNTSVIRNIIFEKVLFTRIEDYYEVKDCLKTHGINAWVNTPRREYSFYKEIKNLLASEKEIEIHITGSEWGLGCNAIHFLDLISFLTDEPELGTLQLNLLDTIVDSKRKGYKEFYGTISGNGNGRLKNFSITCFQGGNMPVQINIVSPDLYLRIFEGRKKSIIASGKKGWEETEQDFSVPYQSQLTGPIMEHIFHEANCNLPSYEESMLLHLEFIEPLITFFEEKGIGKRVCPIT